MITSARSTARHVAAPVRDKGMAGAARWGLTSSLLVILLNFLTGILTARLLGPSGRAGYVTGQVWMVVAAWFCQFGLSAASRVAAARATTEEELEEVVQSTMLLGVCFAAIAAVLPQLPLRALDLAPQLERAASIGSLFAALMLFNEVLCGLLAGMGQIARVSVMRVLFPVGVVVGFGVLVLSDHVTQDTSLVALGGSFVLPILIGLLPLRRLAGWRRVSRRELAGELRFGAKSQFGTLASLANARLDLLVLPTFVTVRQVGLYGLASNLASIMQLAVSQVAGFLVPTLVRTPAERRGELMERCVRVTLLAGLLGAGVASGASWFLLPVVYGQDFAPARPMLVVLLVGSALLATQTMVSAGLQAVDRPGASSLSFLLAVPVTLVGLYFLAPPLGGLGASLVSAAAYASTLVAALALSPSSLVRVRMLLLPSAYLADATALVRRLTHRRRPAPTPIEETLR